jgi:hypothetical protein
MHRRLLKASRNVGLVSTLSHCALMAWAARRLSFDQYGTSPHRAGTLARFSHFAVTTKWNCVGAIVAGNVEAERARRQTQTRLDQVPIALGQGETPAHTERL